MKTMLGPAWSMPSESHGQTLGECGGGLVGWFCSVFDKDGARSSLKECQDHDQQTEEIGLEQGGFKSDTTFSHDKMKQGTYRAEQGEERMDKACIWAQVTRLSPQSSVFKKLSIMLFGMDDQIIPKLNAFEKLSSML